MHGRQHWHETHTKPRPTRRWANRIFDNLFVTWNDVRLTTSARASRSWFSDPAYCTRYQSVSSGHMEVERLSCWVYVTIWVMTNSPLCYGRPSGCRSILLMSVMSAMRDGDEKNFDFVTSALSELNSHLICSKMKADMLIIATQTVFSIIHWLLDAAAGWFLLNTFVLSHIFVLYIVILGGWFCVIMNDDWQNGRKHITRQPSTRHLHPES